MYKVFVNDCQIILTDNKKISTNFNIVFFKNVVLLEVVEQLFQYKMQGICLLCDNLDTSWKEFQSYFKVQVAAGGKVFNSKNNILFIYRLNKWDLPKGKLEKGESIKQCALREVKEECGITNLKIEEQLQTTYHIFKRKGKIILKITYWFLMKSTYLGVLTPQNEEGIEQVVFMDEVALEKALQNTYGNIKMLF